MGLLEGHRIVISVAGRNASPARCGHEVIDYKKISKLKGHCTPAAGEFVEVFIDTPLAVAEGRDVKGLCAKAARVSL